MKLANKMIKKGNNFFSNFIPLREYVGILEIIKIAGANKKNLMKLSLLVKFILNLKLSIKGNSANPAAAGVDHPEKNLILFLFELILSVLCHFHR